MASTMIIDWGFILFTVLVFGGTAGALLCFRHMMHEGDDNYEKSRDKKDEDARAHN